MSTPPEALRTVVRYQAFGPPSREGAAESSTFRASSGEDPLDFRRTRSRGLRRVGAFDGELIEFL